MMFIIDCTMSMGDWIDACKKEMKSIINCVRNQNFNIQIRVSVVAYRDLTSEKNAEVFPFSDDIEKCQAFIDQLRLYNGGDDPEDVAGGLENALNQDWNAKSKYAILICDCPCHGQ
jgi:von Willebrand factor type A domain